MMARFLDSTIKRTDTNTVVLTYNDPDCPGARVTRAFHCPDGGGYVVELIPCRDLMGRMSVEHRQVTRPLGYRGATLHVSSPDDLERAIRSGWKQTAAAWATAMPYLQ